MIPPFKTLPKASWWGSGVQSQTSSPGAPSAAGKLLIRRPLSLAPPQPKPRLAGARRSWTESSSDALVLTPPSSSSAALTRLTRGSASSSLPASQRIPQALVAEPGDDVEVDVEDRLV